jgi:MFS family permease
MNQIAYIVFELSLFGSAFADNFATLVVTRFLGGGGSSVAINIVGGSISDVWKGDKDRSLPMSLFGFTSVAGIALGPFIGSAIVQIRYPDNGLQSPWRWYVSQTHLVLSG